jgi:hypothetical protein
MQCPYCDTPLPDHSTHCTRCDWVAESPEPPTDARDRAAALLSLSPGLGHLYKGHVWFGGLIFFVISPLIAALTLFLLPATLGVILIVPMVFMFAVMLHAYHAPDRRAVVAKEIHEKEMASLHAEGMH